ncbi:three-Cys-motif partner protein TcmP [Caldicellulosiruptor danielii]|uniref:Three-Cys-motif partner protein TcmP n=1 Tax=Anaerocellum danielii TaxID=1387557 RepID=A0ABZ0TZP7_9FIRM|nr:three-Cys-motif partner protein TcmP [Caldicellulosiruptor danielii]WPX08692.1 three-Cys-motif partner protein TcmP [Caldicellulosiruptor danielii]
MKSQDFYMEQTDSSLVKSLIVSNYFDTWLNIVYGYTNKNFVIYVDLYCGPGEYENSKKSTPALIMDKLNSKEALMKKAKNKLLFWFNDSNPILTKKLTECLQTYGLENIKFDKPSVPCNPMTVFITNYELPSVEIETLIRRLDFPILAFLDPWGYKGISKELIDMIVNKPYSDCIFFFNYNRIRPAIENENVIEHVQKILGSEGLKNVKERLMMATTQYQKEIIILDEIIKYFSNNYRRYVVPFRFLTYTTQKQRTSHYIIFVTKNSTAQKVMKEIMSKLCSDTHELHFSYIPPNPQLSFLGIDQSDESKEKIKKRLLQTYAGKELSFKELYAKEGYYNVYTVDQYFDILKDLEIEGKVVFSLPPTKKGNDRKLSADNLYKMGKVKFV